MDIVGALCNSEELEILKSAKFFKKALFVMSKDIDEIKRLVSTKNYNMIVYVVKDYNSIVIESEDYSMTESLLEICLGGNYYHISRKYGYQFIGVVEK